MSQTETLLRFAQQVAAWLGQRWSAADPHGYGNYAVLTGPDGESVILKGDGHNWDESKRAVITGSYPKYNGRPVLSLRDLPKIAAALERGPEAVARDIERRFLSQYRQLVQEALEIRDRYAERNAEAQELAQRFAEAVGEEVSENTGYGLIERPTVQFHNDGGWGSAEVTGDDFHIEARNVPAGLAVKIGVLLREHREGEQVETLGAAMLDEDRLHEFVSRASQYYREPILSILFEIFPELRRE